MDSRTELVKMFFEAFSNVDRNDFVENVLAPDFTFSAPPDPLLNREEFFEKCWPHGGDLQHVEYIRLFEHDNEVFVTHQFIQPDGTKTQNTDILTFKEEKIICLEAYFGWKISS